MNEQEAADVILFECDSESGFLVELHAFASFNQAKWEHLLAAINRYTTFVWSQVQIRKDVADSLYHLYGELKAFRDTRRYIVDVSGHVDNLYDLIMKLTE